MRRFVPSDLLGSSVACERWLRKKADRTRRLYLWYMDKFLGFTGSDLGVKDPDGFLAWAKARDESLEVQDVIDKFVEGQPSGIQAGATVAIRSFLKRNGYTQLPSIDWRSSAKSFHRGYRREEVQELLGFLDDRLQKLYVLFAKDSGLRAHDLLSLRYRHVKKDLEAGMEFCHLYLEPSYYDKRKAAGITFIGPNTVRLLRQLVREGVIGAVNEERILPFAYTTISDALRLARRKAGLELEIQPSHGLRKFFENNLDRVGMDHHKKLQLEGHSQGVRWHYTDRDVEELRKLYTQAYQFLDLSEEAAAGMEVRELKEKLADAEKELAEMRLLKREHDFLEQRVGRLEVQNQGRIVLRPDKS